MTGVPSVRLRIGPQYHRHALIDRKRAQPSLRLVRTAGLRRRDPRIRPRRGRQSLSGPRELQKSCKACRWRQARRALRRPIRSRCTLLAPGMPLSRTRRRPCRRDEACPLRDAMALGGGKYSTFAPSVFECAAAGIRNPVRYSHNLCGKCTFWCSQGLESRKSRPSLGRRESRNVRSQRPRSIRHCRRSRRSHRPRRPVFLRLHAPALHPPPE